MYRLIKSEIDYFKIPLTGILLLLLLFTVFSLGNIKLFAQIVFLKKYFWSMIVGLGSYGLVFFLWMQRVKEKHERMLFLLPTEMKIKGSSRWIFAVLPFTLVMVYIQILHFFLSDDWNLHIGRISVQIGFLSMALAAIFIVRDFWFLKSNKSEMYKIFIGTVIFILAAIGAIIITRIFSYDIVPPLYIHQEELKFFLWGILISSLSLIIFRRRKNYLE